jgi:tetratricopeptide (TPR) repeat protein
MSGVSKPPLALSTLGDYYDLGSFHREVTSSSKEAQIWFNRGLIWSYAFNHGESAYCFGQAIAKDPQCAMAYWGLAYSLGPNYNKPWESFDDLDLESTLNRTTHAAAQAKANAGTASPVEQALIGALKFRYPEDHHIKEWSIWNQGYADAMRSVYTEFQDDLDVATLFADALMNLTPWQLWDLATGQPAPNAHTLEVKQVLDRALDQDGGLAHPGLIHMYIHLMEMSSTPEAALPVADHLRGLVPDAGHLNHMPTHLDVLCGDYQRAIASNSDAIRADEKFFSREGPGNFYTLYRSHNYHFRIYAAMFAGQSKVALDTCTQLEDSITDEVLHIDKTPMADWLEGFLSSRVHVLIRFGRWNDILKLELPRDNKLHDVTTAMMHYGKGVALAATGRVEEADQERDNFHGALKRVLPSRTLFNNKCLDILAIADAMLDGEIEYRRGNFDAAFAHLLRSIALDDALPYDEPWGWMQPTRHAYGALLLEQGHIEQAAVVYSADLGIDGTLPRALRHPNNVWALHGYHECMIKLGRAAEARNIAPQLKLAISQADVEIQSSCFCRLGVLTNTHR